MSYKRNNWLSQELVDDRPTYILYLLQTFIKRNPEHSQKLELFEKDIAKRILKRGPGRAKKAVPKEPGIDFEINKNN